MKNKYGTTIVLAIYKQPSDDLFIWWSEIRCALHVWRCNQIKNDDSFYIDNNWHEKVTKIGMYHHETKKKLLWRAWTNEVEMVNEQKGAQQLEWNTVFHNVNMFVIDATHLLPFILFQMSI